MDHASVARLLSDSLDDFYMREDSADHYEESRSSSPDLSYEIPDSQPQSVVSHLSRSRDFLYESPDSQEDPRGHNLDDDLQEGFRAATSHNGPEPLNALDYSNARLCDITLNEDYPNDVQFDDCASVDSDATEVIEGGTQPSARPEPRFVSP